DFYENSNSVHFNTNDQEVSQMPDPKKVFVVHGRDSSLRDHFFSFLRALGLQPIEWAEALKLTGKASPYIGEAIESAFKSAQAVVVLLSPDDEVRLSPELWKNKENQNEKETSLQARPNVLFEAGMAFGVNPYRTILIEVGEIKPFSDVAGRHVVRLSNSANARNDIAERLKTSGCEVSTSGSDWLSIGNFEMKRELSIMSTEYDPSELTEGDILALLDSWWPKSKELVPEDVTVKFNEVDKLLSLPSGSTKKYIYQVAKRKNFKPVSSGHLLATFEYDITSDDFGSIY
ncbi:nucleotide-binding protein, partial [Desulfonatronospira sp.]|uniref:nucleotide-binding protein n=1 Tax=Desulfonatronospira sp. TaxID=1962951 RepID=UPI0025BBBB47